MSPQIYFGITMTFALLALGVGALGQAKEWRRIKVGGGIACFFCLMAALISMFFQQGTGTVDVFAVELDNDGNVVEQSEDSIWCWSHCRGIPVKISVSSEVHPITKNPKVREIHYLIEVEIADLKTFLREVERRHWRDSAPPDDRIIREAFERTVHYELHEFNNARSQDLAAFYNPLAESQHRELEALIQEYLDKTLPPKGLKMTRLMSFNIR